MPEKDVKVKNHESLPMIASLEGIERNGVQAWSARREPLHRLQLTE